MILLLCHGQESLDSESCMRRHEEKLSQAYGAQWLRKEEMPTFLHGFWGFEFRSSCLQSKQSYTLSRLPPLSDHLTSSVSKEVGQLKYPYVPGLLEIREPFSARNRVPLTWAVTPLHPREAPAPSICS